MKENSTSSIPLVGGTVSAGFPSPASDFMDKSIDLNEMIIKHPHATFFVKVAGDSMNDAGIFEGDILTVDRSLEAVPGKIVIAVLDGELTVKRWQKIKDTFYLVPENKKYKPIAISEERNFEIWGVVTHVIREV
jgi:DNA polymerase V